MTYSIANKDCLTWLKTLEADSVDSCVSDFPSSIGFMSLEWDSDKGGRSNWITWITSVCIEIKRVLKPGAHCLIWALPRTSHWTMTGLEDAGLEIRDVVCHLFGTGFPKNKHCLKPAFEQWILCRKPPEASIEKNVAKWGTGSIQVEASRIELEASVDLTSIQKQKSTSMFRQNLEHEQPHYNSLGRYPANLICSAPSLLGDKAKYFYCPKASRSERNVGLSALAVQPVKRYRADKGTALHSPRRLTPEANNHPTVKPQALMRYLVRLVTPAGGLVIDPFMGSGSTGVACLSEGFSFLGCEKEKGYFRIANARLSYARENMGKSGQKCIEEDI